MKTEMKKLTIAFNDEVQGECYVTVDNPVSMNGIFSQLEMLTEDYVVDLKEDVSCFTIDQDYIDSLSEDNLNEVRDYYEGIVSNGHGCSDCFWHDGKLCVKPTPQVRKCECGGAFDLNSVAVEGKKIVILCEVCKIGTPAYF